MYDVIGRAGLRRRDDISWPSSPIGTVSCTAFVLSHRTGQAPEPPDISWPSSPIGAVSCTAFVLSHRTAGTVSCTAFVHQPAVELYWEEERKEVTEENLTTSTLTVGKNKKQ